MAIPLHASALLVSCHGSWILDHRAWIMDLGSWIPQELLDPDSTVLRKGDHFLDSIIMIKKLNRQQ